MGRKRLRVVDEMSDPPETKTPVELTDDQKAKLWYQHRKKIVALKEKIATHVGELRAEFKLLKSETGILRKEAEFALSLAEADETEVMDAERRRQALARWEGHPLGLQADMFDEVDRTPLVDRAFAEGRRVGLAGDPCKPVHAPETEAYRSFMAGFHEGQKVLAQGIKAPDNADVRPGFLKEKHSAAVDSLVQ